MKYCLKIRVTQMRLNGGSAVNLPYAQDKPLLSFQDFEYIADSAESQPLQSFARVGVIMRNRHL